mmetsp:Transcript_12836/g.40535  ORF Transcript_12836/g.40535 Transcript_12836/m.40535 type:complete len:225 (+) Transcript_12836:110-784(+)
MRLTPFLRCPAPSTPSTCRGTLPKGLVRRSPSTSAHVPSPSPSTTLGRARRRRRTPSAIFTPCLRFLLGTTQSPSAPSTPSTGCGTLRTERNTVLRQIGLLAGWTGCDRCKKGQWRRRRRRRRPTLPPPPPPRTLTVTRLPLRTAATQLRTQRGRLPSTRAPPSLAARPRAGASLIARVRKTRAPASSPARAPRLPRNEPTSLPLSLATQASLARGPDAPTPGR